MQSPYHPFSLILVMHQFQPVFAISISREDLIEWGLITLFKASLPSSLSNGMEWNAITFDRSSILLGSDRRVKDRLHNNNFPWKMCYMKCGVWNYNNFPGDESHFETPTYHNPLRTKAIPKGMTKSSLATIHRRLKTTIPGIFSKFF